MGELKLLDCTLRDGGYLNDWNFGQDVITNIFERLVSAGIDIIEIGFLNQNREYDINRTIMPNTDSVGKIYGHLDRGNSMIVGMIDYGTCDLENIKPCEESYIDGIRVIFKEHLMYEALEFCSKLKEMGYIVFAQLVSVTTYTDDKLFELAQIVNKVEPYALSMVDTYGLLHQSNLLHIFHELDEHLLPSISLGYHAHNNFQMGYANAITVLHENVKRSVLVDGTLYGMGKSAGNAPLELLAMNMNDNYGKSYDIGQLLEAIATSIIEIQKNVSWGYNLFYYVSASTKCHPNYVSYFMNKGTLSMKSINELLLTIDDDKKLLYDKKHAEKKYLDYQKNECDDSESMEKMKEIFYGNNITIFGPGESIKKEKDKISIYMKHDNSIKIAVNYLPNDFKVDYLFLTNSKRYIQISSELKREGNQDVNIIATSNVTRTLADFEYSLNYSRLIDEEEKIPDNSMVMLLKVLMECNVGTVNLIGFDGYSEKQMNYFNTNMEYDFVKNKAEYLNHYVTTFLKDKKELLNIRFITTSFYQEQSDAENI